MESLLACSEEMMEDSPDVSVERREIYNRKIRVHPQVIISPRELTGYTDKNLIQDNRVLPTMLEMEKLSVGYVNNYFATLQTDLTPEMRTAVAIWMFEVCEEERMHDAVYLRAVQYMDKFLSSQCILRGQLQLVGAVCLLLSSKIAGTTIAPKKLVLYTADSVNTEMIFEWEQLLLSVLHWDVYGIVSIDFVQHILCLLPRNLWDNRVVSERIKTFTAYCAVDHQFGVHLPSVIASSSIAAALTPLLDLDSTNKVLSTIQSATHVDLKLMKACMEQISAKVQMSVEGQLKVRVDAASGNDKASAVNNSTSTSGCGIKAR